MPTPTDNTNTPKWRLDIDDILIELKRLAKQDKYIVISPDEADAILDEISRLRQDKCPLCDKRICQLEILCRDCFEERQGSG